jgi:hypothetical protein
MANIKGHSFRVEVREDCKFCGGVITNKRSRTFCSAECRNKTYNIKYAERMAEWQRNKKDREASVADPENKLQCIMCGKWYVQVGTHVYLRHGMTAREYREKFELEVKKGITPEWYRKLKGDQALDNETYKNLEAGAKFRFKRGDKKAGHYKRSPITIKRLQDLHNLKKIV